MLQFLLFILNSNSFCLRARSSSLIRLERSDSFSVIFIDRFLSFSGFIDTDDCLFASNLRIQCDITVGSLMEYLKAISLRLTPKRYSPIAARRISKDKVHPCDESMTSLFSSLLTFMKSTYFRTRHSISLVKQSI